MELNACCSCYHSSFYSCTSDYEGEELGRRLKVQVHSCATYSPAVQACSHIKLVGLENEISGLVDKTLRLVELRKTENRQGTLRESGTDSRH